MIPIEEWINQPEIQRIKDQPLPQLLGESLNRDPMRAIFYNPDLFLSPADGTILYSRVVAPGEQIIPIKGVKYTTEDLLREEVKEVCLVISIFMTCVDVHVNRIPTDGFLHHTHLDPLKVMNLSMRPVEQMILEKLELNLDNLKYGVYNERVKNDIYYSNIKQHYWLIQIADFEVDVIAHFGQPHDNYTQGERFSVVKLGSQVDLIIPFINREVTFISLAKELHHVEAGVDPLVRIIK